MDLSWKRNTVLGKQRRIENVLDRIPAPTKYVFLDEILMLKYVLHYRDFDFSANRYSSDQSILKKNLKILLIIIIPWEFMEFPRLF